MLDTKLKLLAGVIVAIAVLTATMPAPVAAAGTVSSTHSVNGGSNTTVTITYTVSNTGSSGTAYILDVSIPAGWEIIGHNDDGSEWKANENKWLWTNIGAGQTRTPSITITPSDSAGSRTVVTSTLKTTTGAVGSTRNRIDTSATVQGVLEELETVDPATTTTAQMTDSGAGATVTPTQTTTVEAVTFERGSVEGSVTITEYADPPQDISQQVSASITESIADESSSDTAGKASVDIISMADISPASDRAEASAATVELSVPKAEVDNPQQITVVHETTSSTGVKTWEQLETTIKNSTDNEITVTAETDSFSMFATAEIQRPQDDQPPITVVVAITAVLGLLAVAYLRRSQDQ